MESEFSGCLVTLHSPHSTRHYGLIGGGGGKGAFDGRVVAMPGTDESDGRIAGAAPIGGNIPCGGNMPGGRFAGMNCGAIPIVPGGGLFGPPAPSGGVFGAS